MLKDTKVPGRKSKKTAVVNGVQPHSLKKTMIKNQRIPVNGSLAGQKNKSAGESGVLEDRELSYELGASCFLTKPHTYKKMLSVAAAIVTLWLREND